MSKVLQKSFILWVLLPLLGMGQTTRLDSFLTTLLQEQGYRLSFAGGQLSSTEINPVTFTGSWQQQLSQITKKYNLGIRWIDNYAAIYPLPQVNIGGFVKDAETQQSLIGAHIFSADLQIGLVTDVNGYFNYTGYTEIDSLQISYLGYQTYSVAVKDLTSLGDLWMVPNQDLPAVLVVGTQTSGLTYELNSWDDPMFQAKLFEQLPFIGAEPDVVQYATSLPGVFLGSDAVSSIRVRGGGTDQNLFTLDGVPIYYPFHMLGYKSIYSAKQVQSVSFKKSGFSGDQKNRLSSYFDVQSRDPSLFRPTTYFNIQTLAVEGGVSLPLIKNKAGLQLYGTKSFAGNLIRNWSSRQLDLLDIEGYTSVDYFRLGAKGYWRSDSHRNVLRFGVLINEDNYDEQKDIYRNWDPEGEEIDLNFGLYDYGNRIAYVSWDYLPSTQWSSTSKFYYSSNQYLARFENDYFFQDPEFENLIDWYYELSLRSKIEEYGLKHHWKYQRNSFRMKLGTDWQINQYQPGVFQDEILFREADTDSIPTERYRSENEYRSLSGHLFGELAWDWKPWTLQLYQRLNYFNSHGYHSISMSPGFSVRYQLSTKSQLGLDFDRTWQPQHVLSLNPVGLPNEFWVPASEQAPASIGHQIQPHYQYNFRNGLLRLEAYYRHQSQLISIAENAVALNQLGLANIDVSFWDENAFTYQSESYGMEMTLRKKWPFLFSQLIVTWSEANRRYEDLFDSARLPQSFYPNFQFSTHHVVSIGKYYSVGLNWTFTSPSRLVMPPGNYLIFDGVEWVDELIDEDQPWQTYLLPSYHRLNISVNRSWFTDFANYELKVAFSNVYDQINYTHYNLFLDTYEDSYHSARLSRALPIIPSLYFSISF